MSTVTPESIAGAIGGLLTGYIGWLVGISNGDNATAGNWGPWVLMVSVGAGVCAALCGWWLSRRGKRLWAAFAFGLPILPVALTLAILADVYL